MRFRHGRWTALTAVAVVTPFLLLTGCKSGTNLIPLPKMPSIGFGKKKSDTDLAKKRELTPPSETAMAHQNGEAPRYASRTYPDTRLPAPQPGMGGTSPYRPAPSYASATVPPGSQDQPYRQPDYYSPSPAYAGNAPSAGSGRAGGFYDPYPPSYERTATRQSAPGTTGGYGGAQGSPYGDSYSPGPSSYPDSGYRGAGGSALPGSTPDGASDGSYPRPAAFESKMGAMSRDGGVDPYGASAGGASDGAIRLAKGGPSDDRSSSVAAGGACSSGSCSVPPTASTSLADRDGAGSWRPGGTSNYDAGQWESTRTATRQAAPLSSGYRDRSGATTTEQPAGSAYPYSSLPSRDSGFSGAGTYR
jgi:hypothetical protein